MDHIILASTALGLGTCWIGAFDPFLEDAGDGAPAKPDPKESTSTLEATVGGANSDRAWYVLGKGELLAPLNNAANVIYVCPATPLQAALSKVLMADQSYYPRLCEKFNAKRRSFSEGIANLGFEIYDSGSAFYIWARIPKQFDDAIAFNEMLMRDAGVGMTPGSAFADSDAWDAYVRICIAREDTILEGALEKLHKVLG